VFKNFKQLRKHSAVLLVSIKKLAFVKSLVFLFKVRLTHFYRVADIEIKVGFIYNYSYLF